MISNKIKFTTLTTVYPPISNQEAVWLQDDPEVVAELRESDFYMIAARAEAKFLNLTCDTDTHTVDFLFQVGGGPSASVHLDLRAMPGVAALGDAPIEVELGEKGVRVWDGPVRGEGSNVVAWFTTEKLLWDASRGHPGITGLDNLRAFAMYDLLYVGIATKTDSFARLFERGHKARQDILANEPQRCPGARVSDETYLFLFRCTPMVVQTFEPDHDFSDGDLTVIIDDKRIVADAEKAFVSLLQPHYNIQKFASYPRGRDGLYGSDYVRYGYVIGEEVAFNTAHGRICGARDPRTGWITNAADGIVVDGDKVDLFVSGVDFPPD